MDIWRLMKGQVRIANIQLFGYDARLRRRSPDEPYNFQFIIDRFASQDSTSAPLDLTINSIIIRRPGDANGDDYVDAADLVEMINAKNGHASERFVMKNADMDGSGNITQPDIDAVVKIILEVKDDEE